MNDLELAATPVTRIPTRPSRREERLDRPRTHQGRDCPLAAARPAYAHAVDALVCLVKCTPSMWQTTVGLDWISDLIGDAYAAVAGRTLYLVDWLEQTLTTGVAAAEDSVVYRIIDGLASCGDRSAIVLQRG